MSIARFTPPRWPECVQVVATTRDGGVSEAPFESLNLAAHVGDDAAAVEANRRRVACELPQGCRPLWLTQVHGIDVIEATAGMESAPRADASWTRDAGLACAVLTADCLPVLLTDEAGSVVAAAHAGWRGLASGVIEATVASLGVPAASLLAWLGPAIGPDAFEVGGEVRDDFLAGATPAERPYVDRCFRRGPRPAHWLADLHALARIRLARTGVRRIAGDRRCTFHDAEQFFSYRRDGTTGRMAFLVYRHEG